MNVSTARPSGVLRRGACAVGGVVGMPVYFAVELIVRSLNLGRVREPTREEQTVLVRACCDEGPGGAEMLRSVDASRVRLATGARLLTAHRGMTLGRTVFVSGPLRPDDVDDRALLVHELVHVAQRERWGRLGMARRYAAHYCDGFSYRDHAMEVEARRITDIVELWWDRP